MRVQSGTFYDDPQSLRGYDLGDAWASDQTLNTPVPVPMSLEQKVILAVLAYLLFAG